MNRKNDQKYYFLLLFLSFSSLVLITLGRFSLGWSIRGFFDRPLIILQRFSAGLVRQMTAPLAWLVQRQVLTEKNEQQAIEITRLSAELADLAVCQEDNAAMRRMLDAPLPPSWHYLPAKAVEVGGRLKINVGTKAGVEVGQMVISQNILVGRIIQVAPFSSLVELVVDPSVSIPVVTRLAGQKGIRARGVVSGYIGNQLILREVLWDEAVGEGDFVYTSGEGEWLANLLVGKVVRVDGGERKTFREATVEPFFEIKILDSVFVVHDYPQEEE